MPPLVRLGVDLVLVRSVPPRDSGWADPIAEFGFRIGELDSAFHNRHSKGATRYRVVVLTSLPQRRAHLRP